MKPLIYFLMAVLLGSCTSTMQDDKPAPLADFQGRYQSVYTEHQNFLGNREGYFGPAVYTIPIDTNIDDDYLKVHTAFTGTYSIDASSCLSESIQGRYKRDEIISIPFTKFFENTDREKLCTAVVALKPDKPEDSKAPVFGRYSVIKLQVTKRMTNVRTVMRLRQNNPMPLVVFKTIKYNGFYRIRGKCSYDAVSFVKTDVEFAGGSIKLRKDELRKDVTINGLNTTVGLDTSKTGNCYFSLLYSKDINGKFLNRGMLFINQYGETYQPLLITTDRTRTRFKVNGPSETYICGVNRNIRYGKRKCNEKLKKLPEQFLIQAHTNKRSTYQRVTK